MKDKLIIGFDAEAKERYSNQKAIKEKIAVDVLKYVSDYIIIENKEKFLESILDTFKELFEAQTNKAYAQMKVTLEKRMELVGFSYSKLQAFSNYYNEIDIDIFSKETPDFNQYLIGADKVKLYKERLKFVTALNEYLETGAQYFPMKFQQTFKGAFYYDYVTHQITPNLD